MNDELLSAITLNATSGCILRSRDLGRLWECFVLPPQSLTAWDLSLIAAVLPLRSAWTPSLSIHPFTHNPNPASLPSSNQNGCSVEKPPEPRQHKPEVQQEPETLPGGCPSPGGPAPSPCTWAIQEGKEQALEISRTPPWVSVPGEH